MDTVVVLMGVGLVIGLVVFGARFFRSKSDMERFLALDASDIDLATAVLTKKEPMGYVLRSGSEDPDDPAGFRISLRVEATNPMDVERVHLIRPSEAEAWDLGSVHMVSYCKSDPSLWVFADQLLGGTSDDSDAIEVITLHFASPLPLGSMNSPHPWLLPTKKALRVVVIDLNDAHEGGHGRDVQLTNLSVLLAEEIACRTDAQASTVTWLDDARGKMVETTSDDATYDAHIKTWIREGDHSEYIVIHGSANDSSDLSVRFTVQHGQQLHQFVCNAFEAADALVEALAHFGVATASPPSWYQAIPVAEVGLYQAHLGILGILTVQNIGKLPESDWSAEIASAIGMAEHSTRWRALALALARAHLQKNPDDSQVQAFVEATLTMSPFSQLWPCFGRSSGDEPASAAWKEWRERVRSNATLPH